MLPVEIPTRIDFQRGCQEYENREKRDAMYKVARFLVSHYWGKPSHMADGLGVLLLTWNQAFYRYGYFDFDHLEECIAHNFSKIERYSQRNIAELTASDTNDIKHLFTQFLESLQIITLRFSSKNKGKYSRHGFTNLLNQLNIPFQESRNLNTIYKSIHASTIGQAVEYVNDSKKEYVELNISKLGREEHNALYSLNRTMKLIRRSPVSVAKALHLLAPRFFPLWDNKIALKYKCKYNTHPETKYFQFCQIIQTIADNVKDYIEQSDKTLVKLIDEYNYSKYARGWI